MNFAFPSAQISLTGSAHVPTDSVLFMNANANKDESAYAR